MAALQYGIAQADYMLTRHPVNGPGAVATAYRATFGAGTGGWLVRSDGPPAAGSAIVERTFPGTVAVVPDVIAFIGIPATAWGLHPRRLRQLELAVEEVVVNICEYAYEVPPGEFTVSVDPGESSLIVEIVDEGVPFDPLSVEEPDLRAHAAERPVGGLGILLMRRVMDQVTYRREGPRNILSLVIHRS
jgi:anti-sigma regulatory factor (Ser/Thr protein kinase)